MHERGDRVSVTLCRTQGLLFEDAVFLQPAPALMQADESVLIVHL